jgi:tagaturonate reductase
MLPEEFLFELPEKVLQFGTGVLLRGLPDYFIDKANRSGMFNGRIVVVKSTDAGDTAAFDEQDCLYTLCIRGVEGDKKVEENIVCSAISRVLSAKQQWSEVLSCAANPYLNVIISNTTEVGIQLVNETIFQQPPVSFPAKLLAFLHERFKKLGNTPDAGMVVLPTELITDNGKKLKSIVTELAVYNKLEEEFMEWFRQNIRFCNTLVDCIVPGKPESTLQAQIEQKLGYTDRLLAISEVYRLWAIEGGEELKMMLSFAAADSRVVITPDITKYKELKLRLLNGTHTLSCGLAFLAGFRTVKEAMENETMSTFISHLMLQELAPAIPCKLLDNEAVDFGKQVLDRFKNPFLQHEWLNITLQYSSKMAQRTIPVLVRYIEQFKHVPEHFALGFAAYILFMKVVKKKGDSYWGASNDSLYPVRDDQAANFHQVWHEAKMEMVVDTVLQNVALWGMDLSKLDGFATAVKKRLSELQDKGAMQTLRSLTSKSESGV